jgi:hypothetical protein
MAHFGGLGNAEKIAKCVAFLASGDAKLGSSLVRQQPQTAANPPGFQGNLAWRSAGR